MRDFKVHGDHVPVFRDQAKKWYDGDTIAEEDLLRLFTPAHVEMLVEGEALEVLAVEEPQDPPGEEDPPGEPQDPPGEEDPPEDPETTGEPSLAEANAEASDPAAETQDPPVAGKKKGK